MVNGRICQLRGLNVRRIAVVLLLGLLISLCCFAQTNSNSSKASPLSASISFDGSSNQPDTSSNSQRQLVMATILAQPSYQMVLQKLHILFNKYVATCKANTTYSIDNLVTQGASTKYFIEGWKNGRCVVTVTQAIPAQGEAPAFNLTNTCAYTPGSIRYLSSPEVQNTYSESTMQTFLKNLRTINEAECTNNSTN